ncbi:MULTISPECIES: hypothetical protein [Rhodococcus]|uniref:hypothetical protein n=1 Tax=Rhodococcus TaxID=1827 RepID=UPI00143E5206|nr:MULTISPECIES: hypothetical protein [Rhodococcus]QIX48932.1 hypothetical protein HFP48_04755 [Rhodococcus sp. DMU1]QRI76017.1 hypothetical protein JQ505_26675 [Rhodococcus aetherivorans]QSE59428.1 hypothetical protein JYA75_27775 [Rhodococcus sp. PSBB066]QSE69247.1 hypothetical protein JYA91_27680 [Rhodococcus sp. PSBB049]
MAPRTIVSGSDGAALTVADFLANPLLIPTKLKKLLENQFIAESLLRNAGANTSGVFAYHEGDPAFLADDIDELAEFGEITVSNAARGIPKVVFSTKRGKGIRVTLDMIRKNQIDDVNKQITALKNTFIRANDRAAKAIFNSVPSFPVSTAWDVANSRPRRDIADAIFEISQAAPTAEQGGSEDEGYEFAADTIVLNPALLPILMDNDDLLKVYRGNIADQNIAYVGALPETIHNLQIIVSRAWPADRALILERGTIGFYGDARPLTFTELYPEGNGPNGGPRETWRSDATQERGLALDQPQAGLWLTGLVTP